MPRSKASRLKSRKNQHRWKVSLAEQIVRNLEEMAEDVRRAWAVDMQSPEYYPMNTGDVFAQGMARLRGEPERQTAPIELPPPAPPPRSFADLIDEKAVKAVYEDQNGGSYEEALVQAAGDWSKAQSAFHRIIRAIQAAYDIGLYGYDAIPKPRVHFLHRNLLELAYFLGVGDLTHDGIREFFDDLCPCGEQHNVEAIRKLRKRSLKRSRATDRDQNEAQETQ